MGEITLRSTGSTKGAGAAIDNRYGGPDGQIDMHAPHRWLAKAMAEGVGGIHLILAVPTPRFAIRR